MMSRVGADLLGVGDLDEVAIYTRALSASTIGKHYAGIVVSGEEGSEGGGEEPPHEEEPGEEEGPGPGGTGQSYTDAVLSSPGLLDYWSMGEAAGPSSPTASAPAPPTASGGASFGRRRRCARRDRHSGQIRRHQRRRQRQPPPPAGKTAITVEFWMKWNGYGNDDDLAMEYTPNFNSTPAAS